jgi:hypothetical protein
VTDTIAIPGEPRSLAEMHFVAGMDPCRACGDRQPLAWQTGGEGTRWIVRARCTRCGTLRSYQFESARDLLAVRHPSRELGGREPSRILDPYALVHEIDRLVPTIVTEPGQLIDPEWSRNFERIVRVQTALAELAKFIPTGEQRVPGIRHRDSRGHDDARARPERYSRMWIDETRVRWEAIAARLSREAAQIAGNPRVLSRGFLDRQALADHAAWLRRGRTGSGRMDVLGLDADGLMLDGADLSAARLERVRITRASFVEAKLLDAELTDCELDAARLSRAVLDQARLVRCSLEQALLAATSWRGAHVEDCHLLAASLAGARLEGARFVRCDLRGVDLTGASLAGATLVACKVAGAHGVPAGSADLTVEDGDFSDHGDGSDLGDVEDLLAILG